MSCDLSDSVIWLRDLEGWYRDSSMARNVYLDACRLHVKDLEQRIIEFSAGYDLSGLFDDDWLWCRDSTPSPHAHLLQVFCHRTRWSLNRGDCGECAPTLELTTAGDLQDQLAKHAYFLTAERRTFYPRTPVACHR
jgi:hypothetical protein